MLTFTVEAEVALARPADLERFVTALAERVADTVADFTAEGGRHYRVVLAGHPAPHDPASTESRKDGS